MLFAVPSSCRRTLKVQARDEQIASMGMFFSRGDPATDCRGNLSSRPNCHNQEVIHCIFITAIIYVFTIHT